MLAATPTGSGAAGAAGLTAAVPVSEAVEGAADAVAAPGFTVPVGPSAFAPPGPDDGGIDGGMSVPPVPPLPPAAAPPAELTAPTVPTAPTVLIASSAPSASSAVVGVTGVEGVGRDAWVTLPARLLREATASSARLTVASRG